jgi:hypothetical protein
LQDYIKQVVEILNGLNPSTYVNLLPKIKAFNLNTEERLSEVSKLLYEKVLGVLYLKQASYHLNVTLGCWRAQFLVDVRQNVPMFVVEEAKRFESNWCVKLQSNVIGSMS